tara:strand:+ start:2708 stop:3271 length:564 start_codon:yes stop_codon:yes gene_type:complete
MRMIVLVFLILLFFTLLTNTNVKSYPVEAQALHAYLIEGSKQDELRDTESDSKVGQPGRKSIQIHDPYVYDMLGRIAPRGYWVSREVPPEYRVYFTGSSGMAWHRDQRVIDGDYLEAVLTLHNTSDSEFEHKALFGTRSIRPRVGTLVMVKPGGIYHRVTPVTTGSREILKFVLSPHHVGTPTCAAR